MRHCGTLPRDPVRTVIMPLEIERKFLLVNDGWRLAVARTLKLAQGYLDRSERCSVRVRLEGSEARLNIKSRTLGVSRLEYEYPVPVEEAREMLAQLCGGRVIEKTRHFVPAGAHTFEIDVFEGENAGLVVAEIELGAPDESFERPPWLGEEVSHDIRYYNTSLIDLPYTRWT